MIRREILDVIDNSDLDMDEMKFLLDKLCNVLIKTETEISTKVSLYLKTRVTLEGMTREEMAAQLCMSSRTLSRKLKKENAAFHDILKEERKRRCLEYLSRKDINGAELAEILGLADLSHFYKAFKQWTGLRFSEYKLKMAENNHKSDTNIHRHRIENN